MKTKLSLLYTSLLLMPLAYAKVATYPQMILFANSTSQPLALFKNSFKEKRASDGVDLYKEDLLAVIPIGHAVWFKIEPSCLKDSSIAPCSGQGLGCLKDPASETCSGFTAGTISTGNPRDYSSTNRITSFNLSSNDTVVEFKIDGNNNISVSRRK